MLSCVLYPPPTEPRCSPSPSPPPSVRWYQVKEPARASFFLTPRFAHSAMSLLCSRSRTATVVPSCTRSFATCNPLLAASTAHLPKRDSTLYGAHQPIPRSKWPIKSQTDTSAHPLWKFFHQQQSLQVPDKRQDNTSPSLALAALPCPALPSLTLSRTHTHRPLLDLPRTASQILRGPARAMVHPPPRAQRPPHPTRGSEEVTHRLERVLGPGGHVEDGKARFLPPFSPGLAARSRLTSSSSCLLHPPLSLSRTRPPHAHRPKNP